MAVRVGGWRTGKGQHDGWWRGTTRRTTQRPSAAGSPCGGVRCDTSAGGRAQRNPTPACLRHPPPLSRHRRHRAATATAVTGPPNDCPQKPAPADGANQPITDSLIRSGRCLRGCRPAGIQGGVTAPRTQPPTSRPWHKRATNAARPMVARAEPCERGKQSAAGGPHPVRGAAGRHIQEPPGRPPSRGRTSQPRDVTRAGVTRCVTQSDASCEEGSAGDAGGLEAVGVSLLLRCDARDETRTWRLFQLSYVTHQSRSHPTI